MPPQQRREPRNVVERSVSHYLVEKLSDGTIRLKSGGHVVESDNYYKALERFAAGQFEHLEELPEHLYEDQYGSPYNDVAHPERRVPVVVGTTVEGDERILRVCDLESDAESVADAYRPDGTINTVAEYDSIDIVYVRHGSAR
jgi:hypothetical protein